MGTSDGAPAAAWSPEFSQGLFLFCDLVSLSLFIAPGFLGKLLIWPREYACPQATVDEPENWS